MRWCFHLNTVFTTGLERTRRIKDLHLNLQQSQEALADHQEQGQSHPQRERVIKEKLKMAKLMVEVSFIEKKHISRYQAENLELEEKVAKSKSKVKVFEELEQPPTALRTSFASRKNAPF